MKKTNKKITNQLPTFDFNPYIELLEPRLLFDSAMAVEFEIANETNTEVEPNAFHQEVEHQALLAALEQVNPELSTTVAFVDLNLQNAQDIINSLDNNISVYPIPANQDGLETINTALSNHHTIEAIHIFSHGKPGELILGNSTVNQLTINQLYTDQFKLLATKLNDTADIFIYGCNVASSIVGQNTIALLAKLTGADIAASTDITGAATKGGNWHLEYQLGEINQHPSILPAQFRQHYAHTLAAPGNVDGGSLTTWLKADAGVTEAGSLVSAWQDQSVNGGDNTVVQALDAQKPTLLNSNDANAANFNPVLFFDSSGASDDYLTKTMVTGTDLISAANNTIFAVVNVTSVGVVIQWEQINGLFGDNRISIEYEAPNNPRLDFPTDAVTNKIVSNTVSTNYHIITGVTSAALNSLFVDGLEKGTTIPTATADPTQSGTLAVGTFPELIGLVTPTMNLAEIIIYNTNLSLANKQQVESYLAIKYGTTLDTTDSDGSIIEGDYKSSDGTIVWNAINNATFHNDVAGLGQDDNSALDQTQSQSINSDSILTASGASSQDNGDFFIWGNNNGSLTETTTDKPLGVNQRITREWKVQETGDIGTVDFSFDLSTIATTGTVTSDFGLLVDTDGDGDFTTGTVNTIAATSYDGTNLTFDNLNIANGDVFTIASSLNQGPSINNIGGDSQTYNREDGAQLIDQGNNANIVDVDNANFNGGSLTVQFTAGNDNAEDQLAIRSQGNGVGQIGVAGNTVSFGGTAIGTLSGGTGGTPLQINFNANATPAATSALVKQISYENIDTSNPTAGNRTIQYTLNDGNGGISLPVQASVNVNGTPVISSLNGDSFTYNRGDGTQLIDQGNNANVVDIDNANFNSGNLTVQFTAGNDNAEDQLVIRSQGNGIGQISVAGNTVSFGGTAIGTLSGGTGGIPLQINFNANATPAATSALVKQISYENTDTSNPTAGNRTIQYTLNDGNGSNSVPAQTTVNVNGTPIIKNLSGDSQIYLKGSGLLPIDTRQNAIVVDPDNANFSGGRLTVQLLTGSDKQNDQLVIRSTGNDLNQIKISGSSINFSGVTIGTFIGGSKNIPLTINLNNQATPAALSALVQNIAFSNNETLPLPGNRTIQFQLTDGKGGFSPSINANIEVAKTTAPALVISTQTKLDIDILPEEPLKEVDEELTTTSTDEQQLLNITTIVNQPLMPINIVNATKDYHSIGHQNPDTTRTANSLFNKSPTSDQEIIQRPVIVELEKSTLKASEFLIVSSKADSRGLFGSLEHSNQLKGQQVVGYNAQLIDGSALPVWFHFDNNKGTFNGSPPADVDQISLKINVKLANGDIVLREVTINTHTGEVHYQQQSAQ
ncbi:DUF4347 domain-containing protein [Spartinivicinus ruber]|uniref:DUF4347 domain-containing protein n=1 Tax=Spartinivicinus ruber TaxID=2683272 RepID=UPI0013D7C342|nr:DUF4347 domain-containing protein [Spartinivicinus ruber]